MYSARPALAEASRILKRGGLFAFCVSTPIRDISYEDHEDGSYSVTRSFQRPYGEWIRLFRENRFAIEGLIELRPPLATETTYTEFAPLEWARDFPAEHIWKLCRE
jgi:hypothetical protein